MSYVVEVDVKKVRDAGNEIVDNAKLMYNALTAIKDIVNGTKSYFSSEGGDKARAVFNKCSEVFDGFKTETESYGNYLVGYADGLYRLDDEIQNVISEFPSLE